MAVFRAGPGYGRAKRQFKSGYYPVSEQNDTSTLWGNIEDTRDQPGFIPDVTVLPGEGWIQGDYLVFGVKPFSKTSIFFVCLPAIYGLTYLFTPLQGYSLLWGALSLLLLALWFCYCYPVFRNPRFVVFDRRHGLVHLPRTFSHKQDCVVWDQADFIVINLDRTLYKSSPSLSGELYVCRPPWDLVKHGYPSPFKVTLFLMEPDDPGENYTEPAFRHIVQFMTEPVHGVGPLKDTVEGDHLLSEHFNNDFVQYRKTAGRLWALLDPEKLPAKPNWMRDEQGEWQQIAPARRVRAGLFGFWGQSHTLPPHLIGTRADPDYQDEPEAPDPWGRWLYDPENPVCTGDLVGQPDAVIDAVLKEGMPALARFPQAAARAKQQRERHQREYAQRQAEAKQRQEARITQEQQQQQERLERLAARYPQSVVPALALDPKGSYRCEYCQGSVMGQYALTVGALVFCCEAHREQFITENSSEQPA